MFAPINDSYEPVYTIDTGTEILKNLIFRY